MGEPPTALSNWVGSIEAYQRCILENPLLLKTASCGSETSRRVAACARPWSKTIKSHWSLLNVFSYCTWFCLVFPYSFFIYGCYPKHQCEEKIFFSHCYNLPPLKKVKATRPRMMVSSTECWIWIRPIRPWSWKVASSFPWWSRIKR